MFNYLGDYFMFIFLLFYSLDQFEEIHVFTRSKLITHYVNCDERWWSVYCDEDERSKLITHYINCDARCRSVYCDEDERC